MEYAEPTNVLIVGDGDFIVYNDGRMPLNMQLSSLITQLKLENK